MISITMPNLVRPSSNFSYLKEILKSLETHLDLIKQTMEKGNR